MVDELIARADWRRRFPELREVIDWVQDLRQWFERRYDKPARAALWKLIEQARESALAPLQGMAGTLSRWFEPIWVSPMFWPPHPTYNTDKEPFYRLYGSYT